MRAGAVSASSPALLASTEDTMHFDPDPKPLPTPEPDDGGDDGEPTE